MRTEKEQFNARRIYISHLEQLAHDAAKLLEDISHPFRNVERYDVERWLKHYRELFEQQEGNYESPAGPHR